MNTLKKTLWAAAFMAGIALSACGGGGSSSASQGGNSIGWNATPDWIPPPSGSGSSSNNSPPSAPDDNTVPAHVESAGFVNRLIVSVKVCVPGMESAPQCVILDNMLVDTGSTGVRISARAIPTIAPLLLTQVGAVDDKPGASPIQECAGFASGFVWGSLKRADITIGSKTANNVPIQLISDGAFAAPDDCTAHNGYDLSNSLDAMGVSGILGIDNFAGDSQDALTKALPGLYYYCDQQTQICTSTRMLASKEVTNPVTAFATDNNGTVLRLPAVPATGQSGVTGQLVFGVNTQQNNMLPANATVIALDKYGTFATQYKGRVFNRSAIDSGTAAYAFPDKSIPASDDGLYTPVSALNLNATVEANNGTGAPMAMPFSIDNADTLMASGNSSFNNVGQYFSDIDNMFLWGLPFFYGRDVYNVISNARVANLTGPFVAF